MEDFILVHSLESKNLFKVKTGYGRFTFSGNTPLRVFTIFFSSKLYSFVDILKFITIFNRIFELGHFPNYPQATTFDYHIGFFFHIK